MLYHSPDGQQNDVDIWMDDYNAERMHSGKYKQLDPIQPRVEAETVTV